MKANFMLLILASAALPVGGKSQANQNLSNLLSPTAVNQYLLPNGDNTKDLGSSGRSWRNIYMDGYFYLDGSRFISNPASNMAVGTQAGNVSMTGIQNTLIGSNAGFSMSSANYNTFLGSFAGYLNNTGSENTFVGEAAGNLNSGGYYNTFVGRRAGYSNKTGGYNTGVGRYALRANLDGSSNTAIGAGALSSNTSGDINTAVGDNALVLNTTGSHNTSVGASSLYSNVNGLANTAMGENTLANNTSGSYNSAYGFFALFNNTTGSYNTALGEGCGNKNDANTHCSFFGYDANQSVTTDFVNSTAIGSQSRMTASNQVRLGNSSVTSIGGYVGWSNISDERMKKDTKENVPGLSFINKLKPVTYHLDVTRMRNFLNEDKRDNEMQERSDAGKIEEAIKGKEKIVYTGFLAQQVEKAAVELGYEFSGVDKPQDENSLYGLRYAEFVVPLVKAVQELDINQKGQNNELADLKKENIELRERLARLEAIINAQQSLSMGQTLSNLPAGQASIKLAESNTSLQQNVPNPFNHTTTINYVLPQQFSSAKIIVIDKNGKILKDINVSGSGKGALTVDASTLSSGAYHYSLYVNGKLIDTKQMEHLK